MEEVAREYGKLLLYGIAAVVCMSLIIGTYRSGGIIYSAVQTFMEEICG